MEDEVHPVIRAHHNRSLGEKAADSITTLAGSWTFIFSFVMFLVIWMIINIIGFVSKWDPYPFILLNLVLSCIAALQAPVILMSQNRETQRDRIRAEYDFKVNKLAEREVRELKDEISYLKKEIGYLRQLLEVKVKRK